MISPLVSAYNRIMRRFLVILLTILTVAGPGLCCCTLPRLAPQAAEVPSCCHAPTEGQPEPCKHECPCRELRETPAVIAKVAPVVLSVPSGDFVAWDVVALVPGVLVSIEAVGLPPPFLSAELLLHVHHRLRC